jgi:hypothetical protein
VSYQLKEALVCSGVHEDDNYPNYWIPIH